MTSTLWQPPIWSETLNEAPEPKAVDAQAIERESMEFDVVIVGAGPAGLAAAIRLKQLAAETGNELSVVVLEKGSDVGAHILSGAVIDPVGLDALIPDWRDKGSPLTTKVSEDRFYYLWKTGGIRVPSYTASKHGVAGLTKLLANEWAAKSINVNAIAPGYVRTEATQALQDDPVRNVRLVSRIPAGRWGEPGDMGGAAVFLSSRAADYCHGTILVVDGGWLAT
jgi:NAD(P)-dependent dehydrogenase (short-subunit alcohol dehydrogenase family)